MITQHQDCPVPVIQAAEKAGLMSVGYHVDDQKFAANGWLTAAVWDWTKLFPSLVTQVLDKSYKPSVARFWLKDGVVDLAPFGSKVTKDVQDKIAAAKAKMASTDPYLAFTGQPIKDQSGKVRIENGTTPTIEFLESIDWLVEGVPGQSRTRRNGAVDAETHGPVSNFSRGLQQTERHAGTAARPYVWPYDGAIDPAHTALLLFTGDTETEASLDVIQRWGAAPLAAVERRPPRSLPRRKRLVRSELPFEPDLVIERPRLGAFWGSRHRPGAAQRRPDAPADRGLPVRARRRLHDAGGQRPGLRMPAGRRLLLRPGR